MASSLSSYLTGGTCKVAIDGGPALDLIRFTSTPHIIQFLTKFLITSKRRPRQNDTSFDLVSALSIPLQQQTQA